MRNRQDAIRLALEVDGFMSEEELGWLYDRASEVPEGGTWVEVGTWKGRSFSAVARGLPQKCYLVGVDNWEGNAEGDQTTLEIQEEGYEVVAADFAKRVGELKNERIDIEIDVWFEDSLNVAGYFSDIDAVFLDGSHEEEDVRMDIQAWREALKPGGLMCGHDYKSVRKGVISEIDAPVMGPGTIWWVRI